MYGISVAAELVGMGVQTLRLYEARGLLQPARTDGGTRRYSADDLDRLRRIGDLLDAGLNLAGISMVLNLQDQNTQLEDQNTLLEDQNTQLRADRATPTEYARLEGDPGYVVGSAARNLAETHRCGFVRYLLMADCACRRCARERLRARRRCREGRRLGSRAARPSQGVPRRPSSGGR